MKKQIFIFALALFILVLAVSAWVGIQRIKDFWPVENEVAITETNEDIVDSESPVYKKKGGEIIPRSKNFNERLSAGENFFANSDFEHAENEFVATAALEPGEITPLLRLAKTQIKLGKFESARENLYSAEKLDAVHPEIFLLRGQIFLKEKKFVEAEKEFGKAGTDGRLWQGVMKAFYDKTQEAKKLLEQSHDSKAGEILMAYSEYEQFPDSPKTHLDTLIARALIKIEVYQLAIAKLKPVLADDADYRDAWLLFGYAQFAIEKFDLARQAWQTAFELDPTYPETQYFFGLVNFELGNFSEAEKFFLLARANKFESDKLEKKLIETYLAEGKYRSAADLLVQKLETDPDTAIDDFTQPISLYLEKIGDGGKAWSLASIGLERFPDEPLAYNLAGWVSLSNNYLVEAYNQLKTAISLDKNLAWPYFNFGKYFEKMGDIPAALEAYQKAFEMDSADEVGVFAAQNYNRLLEKTNLVIDE